MLKIISTGLLLYALACIVLYTKQRSLLYFPTPENFNALAEAWWFETNEVKLKIWKINQGEKAILYFGGNAEAVEGNLDSFKKMFGGYSVYLVNYRGFGGSTGQPTEQGLNQDALALYDELITQHTSISVIGRSLGSGLACYLAANREIHKLALITPYDSIKNLAQSLYPLFPVKWLIKDHFDSLLIAPSLSNDTLILLAEKDEVIPLKHSQLLINALGGTRLQTHTIRGANHNDISALPVTQQLLSGFMQ